MKRIFLIILALLFLATPSFAQSITVGSACIDRADSGSDRTRVDANNAANGTGTIDTVQVWAATEMTGIEFAAFEKVGGDKFTTRGNTNGSNLTAPAGSCTTFTAPGDFTAFAIETGDFIGAYWTGGDLESDTGGTSWKGTGDYIPCTNQALDPDTDFFSLYATGNGVTAGQVIIVN